MDDEISFMSFSIEAWDALITKCDFRTALGSVSDIEWFFANDWYLDHLGNSKSSLSRRYRDSIVEICSFAGESTLTLRYFKCDIEITIAIVSVVAFTADLYAHAIFDPRRDIDGFLDFFLEFPFSVAVCTGIDDLGSCTMTRMAGTCLFHDAKKCLDAFANLPLSMTRFAGFCSSTLSTAVMTLTLTIEFDLTIGSVDGIFE